MTKLFQRWLAKHFGAQCAYSDPAAASISAAILTLQNDPGDAVNVPGPIREATPNEPRQ